MARSKEPIDWEQIKRLTTAGAGAPAIAEIMKISSETIYRRCKSDLKMDFVDFRAKNKEIGNDALLTKGYSLAINGDKTMLIFYLKNRCGFADHTIIDATVSEATEEAFLKAMNRIAEAKAKR